MKTIIGFIIFGDHTAKYLPYFLLSLKNQTLKDCKIIAFNNGAAEDENVKYLRDNYPEIEIMGEGINLGFAAAYNRMIARAFDARADYFLMANPDMIFEPDVLEKLAQRLAVDPELGSAGPKILRWDFSAEAAGAKTDIVDSYGIGLKSGLRFFDIGQGQKDDKKIRYQRIIGPSGACGLFKMAALERVKENGKYLDDRMFMYKEDCDLDYRLYLIHQEFSCVPEAVVYHDRTAAAAGKDWLARLRARKLKSKDVKRWSLHNQQLIYKKYWQLQDFWSKINIVIFEITAFLFILLFERFLLKDYFSIFKKR